MSFNTPLLTLGVDPSRNRFRGTTTTTQAPRRDETQTLFNGAARGYKEISQLLSGGQYLRWRDHLVHRVRQHGITTGDDVLDVATGTGLIAHQIEKTTGAHVTGADLTLGMLRAARRAGLSQRLRSARRLVTADAERLPYPHDRFHAVTTSYLLRYVDDPAKTLKRLVDHVRPKGFFGLIEFYVPLHPAWRLLWRAHTQIVLPGAGALAGSGWRRVGRFLGGSIETFWQIYDLDRLRNDMEQAGLQDVHIETLSLGGGLVAWGTKSAPRPSNDKNRKPNPLVKNDVRPT